LIWNHGDRDLIGVFIHCAGRGIDTEADNASKHHIPAAIASVFEAITPDPGK
jgi:hypothetical protein